jgi:hypothetical protein
MAVSSEVARVVHTANGVATFFSFFPIDGVTPANLKVYLFNPATGVLTLQTLGTHYTFGSGGVTFNTAPPSGRRVILFRQVELLQPDIYKTNAPFPATVTEKRFDEIVKGLQQLNDVVQNRAIILPLGDAGFSSNTLPAVEARKGRVLYFNATTGDPEAQQLADTVVTAPTWAVSFLSRSTAAAGLAYIGGVAKAGDTMTGPLTLPGAPTATLHAATKGYVDTEVGTRVAKSGDTMTGFLTLHANPTAAMHAATKQYVDSITMPDNYVLKSGDTMTGNLTISKPSALLELNSATPSLRGLQFSTNGLRRWRFYAWNDAESGGDAGSTLYLSRYDDAGDPIAHVFFVDRSTGRLTFSGSVLPRLPGLDPTHPNDIVRKDYADRAGPGGSTGMIATSGGTTYDVTGIPSWANVIEVLFIDITTASSTNLRVRLGTSSGFVSSGYISAYGSRLGEFGDTTCLLGPVASVHSANAIMRIVRASGNQWVAALAGSEQQGVLAGGGSTVDIGAALTQIRVFVTSANFTGGHFVVRWTA